MKKSKTEKQATFTLFEAFIRAKDVAFVVFCFHIFVLLVKFCLWCFLRSWFFRKKSKQAWNCFNNLNLPYYSPTLAELFNSTLFILPKCAFSKKRVKKLNSSALVSIFTVLMNPPCDLSVWLYIRNK